MKQNAHRLKRIREVLQLSQRELAREFGVTGAAVTLWEKGARPVPGPVVKLIEIYEENLGFENDETARGEFLRKLATSWTERIFSTIRPHQLKRGELNECSRQTLQNAVLAYLGRSLSRDQVRRNIQLSLVGQLVKSLGRMKGLPMKAAQMATYMDLGMSPEIRDILASLQTTSPPMAPTVAARVVFEELGAPPQKLFLEWSPKPFAAASIGQVHLARLRSGQRVAVKVQYPDVAQSIQRDCAKLLFLDRLAVLLKRDNAEVIEEIERRLLEECDYRREAEYQRDFRQRFAGDPHIVVPAVFPELSGSRVLTMEYIEGKSFRQFRDTASQDEKNTAGKTLVRFYSTAIFRHRLLHGDPHAGNFIFAGDKVAFLDYGRVAPYDPKVTEHNRQLLLALFSGDVSAGRAAFRELGMVRDWQRFDFDGFWDLLKQQQAHHLVEGPFRFTPEFVDGIRRANQAFSQKDNMRLTRDFFWSICVHHSLWLLLAELRAEANWREMAFDALKP